MFRPNDHEIATLTSALLLRAEYFDKGAAEAQLGADAPAHVPAPPTKNKDGSESIDCTPTPAAYARLAKVCTEQASDSRELLKRIEEEDEMELPGNVRPQRTLLNASEAFVDALNSATDIERRHALRVLALTCEDTRKRPSVREVSKLVASLIKSVAPGITP